MKKTILALLLVLPGCLPFGGNAVDPSVNLPPANNPGTAITLEDPNFGPGKGMRDANGCLVAKAAEVAFGYLFVGSIQAGDYEMPIQESINILRLQQRINLLLQEPPAEPVSQIQILVDGGTVTFADGSSGGLEVPGGVIEINLDPPASIQNGLPKFCILDNVQKQDDGISQLSPSQIFLLGH